MPEDIYLVGKLEGLNKKYCTQFLFKNWHANNLTRTLDYVLALLILHNVRYCYLVGKFSGEGLNKKYCTQFLFKN